MKLGLLGIFLAGNLAWGTEQIQMFPFVISYDAPDNVANMAHLLDAPAGKHGQVRVLDGHFVTDAGRIRFHATNLTGPANFPAKEEAEKIASRLARFGFNCVRLHYMDADYGNFMEKKQRGIIADSPQTQRDLDPVQLDRLDYLIATLKRHGIYVNINLHVARDFDKRDGFPEAHPWADKGIDNFEPRLIDLQKEYARKLLTHVNPYTRLPYTQDPCVAMVEINNENALQTSYNWDYFSSLGPVHKAELQRHWNKWLLKKYNTTDALAMAWNLNTMPLGEEQITDGRFDVPIVPDGKTWCLSKEKSTVSLFTKNGVLCLDVKASNKLFPKLFRSTTVVRGKPYTVSFRIRKVKGEVPAEIGFCIADAVNGWRELGVLGRTKVGRAWTTVTRGFRATETSKSAQVQITRFTPGVFEIDDISFRMGATNIFKLADAKIEDGTIAFPLKQDSFYAQVKEDVNEFLKDTEKAYWTGIHAFLHNELGVRAPVSGTQLSYSYPSVQAELDYCDEHIYWHHPSPVSKNWTLRNECMVNSLYCVNQLNQNRNRVRGKPFTVSEYNHPYPNFYGAEGQPFLRSYGAALGWDGVFEYTYNHRSFFEPDYNTYFFSIVARTDVLAHMPACAAIYLRGDVRETGSLWKPGKGKILVTENKQLIWNKEKTGKAYFTVNTPNTKLFTGFPEGRVIPLGDVKLSIGKTRLDWATVSLTSRNATGFSGPGSSLLAATGLSHNNGAVFTNHGGNTISSRAKDWGKGPVMNEGIPAILTLPSPAKKTVCFALDCRGERKTPVPVTADVNGKAMITIGPRYQTVWYEVTVQ